MRIFNEDTNVKLKTSEGRFEGTVAYSTESYITLKNVSLNNGKRFPELRFYSYEVIKIFPCNKSPEKSLSPPTQVNGNGPCRVRPDLREDVQTCEIESDWPEIDEDALKNDDELSHVSFISTNNADVVHRDGALPVASIKTVPLHLRVWGPADKQEELLAVAVKREQEGGSVDLEVDLLSEKSLLNFLSNGPASLASQSIANHFTIIEEMKSPQYQTCIRHLLTMDMISVSWEGIKSRKQSDNASEISFICVGSPYIVVIFDLVAMLKNTVEFPPDLCTILNGESENSPVVVMYDAREFARILLSEWSIYLSPKVVDLQVFDACSNCLLSKDSRRIDGKSVSVCPSLHAMLDSELGVVREQLFIREHYRLEDSKLWFIRPLCHVLVNDAIGRARYLLALYQRQISRLMQSIMSNSECRWKSAALGEEGNLLDPCQVQLNFDDPLRLWRTLPFNTKSRNTFTEMWKARQGKMNKVGRVTGRSSFGNAGVTISNTDANDRRKSDPHSYAGGETANQASTIGVGHYGYGNMMAECPMVIDARSAEPYDEDEDFGIIPSRKETHEPLPSTFSTRFKNKSWLCSNNHKDAHETYDQPNNNGIHNQPPNSLPASLFRQIGRGRGINRSRVSDDDDSW